MLNENCILLFTMFQNFQNIGFSVIKVYYLMQIQIVLRRLDLVARI